VAVLLVTLAGVLVSCSDGSDDDTDVSYGSDQTEIGAPAGATEPAPVPPPPAEPGADTPPEVRPVGTTVVDIVDEGRGRRLVTRVHYPAAPGAGGPDAAPAGGLFPLVVMAHGYRLTADGYGRLLDGVAARGYVVAAPDFPHTSANGGDGNRLDLVNQPADVGVVADRLVTESARPGSLIPAIGRPDHFAVMGHSDGGLMAAAMGYNSSYRDDRVTAVVTLSGGASGFPGEWSVPDPPPLLAVHGNQDATNPISATDQLVERLPDTVPRHVVVIDGGDHIGPYMGDTALPGLATVIADFLDVHLLERGELSATDRLHNDASIPPLRLTAE
jgi:predicted dienelactone hydrolase